MKKSVKQKVKEGYFDEIIITGLAYGVHYQEIEKVFGIKKHYIGYAVRYLLEKYNLRNKVQLVLYYIKYINNIKTWNTLCKKYKK